jgi:uncharacterized surface protein with fasciclin (FAS1) repeats
MQRNTFRGGSVLRDVLSRFLSASRSTSGLLSTALGLQANLLTGKIMTFYVDNSPPNRNLIDSVESLGTFTLLRKALDAAGLMDELSASGPYTFFAPDDRAFGKLPKGTLEDWLKPENKAELVSVLKYHVLPGLASAADVGTMSRPQMMQGQSAVITKEGDKIRIDGANLIAVDIASNNGVIHIIDSVIQPIEPATQQ